MDQVLLKPLDVDEAGFESVVDVFCSTFIRDQYSETDFFQGKANIMKHSHFPDFKGVVAMTATDEVVGFAYGFTSKPGQFFRSQLEKVLTEQDVEDWLKRSFEMVELAVRPSYRGLGIGEKLHDALLEGLPHHRAILAASTENVRAISLYEKKDWIVIEESAIIIPGLGPHIIMGKDLKGLMRAKVV